ncbi:transcription factor [Ganoderma sinense ZZ0214-1]|uniref:Transcription factor n=1 Tax=Ganoderma sinense ZZ0214-1 TaxID=1077348 RepID=A0A2G8SPZ5_9APHY|nr:transcription factor [Ganoderma sinense ZZ0214-1]
MLGHPSPAYQQPPPQQQQPQQQPPPAQPPTADPNVLHHSPPQPQPPGTFQTLRLRDDPPAVTQPAPRASRKRKSPATAPTDSAPPPPPGPPNPAAMHLPPPGTMQPHALPPPHTLIHPPPHMTGHPIPHPYPYPPPPGDFTPGGMPPPPHPGGPPPGHPGGPLPQPQPDQSRSGTTSGRTLSQSKRAEQNRKAQRAFRERRDQHVKTLESRSQLLDAALASADEANRRWEECRTIVDQLRIENATLRAALQAAQAQLMAVNPNANVPMPDPVAAGVNGANGAPPTQPPPEHIQQTPGRHDAEKKEEQGPSLGEGDKK